ncbi:MAG: hypothetical protein JKX78_03705 [Alteromonadaceae bacterium]|nr:hypothetical protein [Alteromonadaceae bacterium]MBL4909124.1 hypothetical protein [Alteromonadaceae bacterium]
MKIYATDDNDLAVIGMGEKWTIKDINFAFGCGMNRSRLLVKKAIRCGVMQKGVDENKAFTVIAKYTYNLDTINAADASIK